MNRGLSTVIDVAVCVLLVGGAVLALSSVVPDGGHGTPDARPAAAARAVLDSTATVAVGNETVHGTVATLLADAVVARGSPGDAPGYADRVRNATARRLANATRRASLTATWRPESPCHQVALAVGPRPPAGASVDAVTLSVPTANATACGRAPVHLTVRTWSR